MNPELTLRELYQKRLFNYIRLNGYSLENTLPLYRCNLNLLLNKFPEPEKADLLQLQDFAAEFKNDNTRKNMCVIIRWLFNKVLGRNIQYYELPYPKKKKKVQPVYQEQDILKVLHSITNAKQKAILALIIDCGLRVSEPCDILIKDCNSKNRSIVLRAAKGDNDRIIYPSQSVWDLIKVYWNSWKEKPSTYLFEGQTPGNPYTAESIRGFLYHHCQKTGVQYLGVHAIRRFTITWSIENQVPVPVMADKVGHASGRTIEKHYLIHSPAYLKNIASPLR